MENRNYEVKFKQEDFDKLTQLNRVEYRQREDRINKHYNYSIVVFVDFFFAFAFGFLILFFTSAYGSFGKQVVYSFFQLFRIVSILFIILFIVAFICDGVLIMLKRKELRKLQEQYFKIKIEVK
jgi:hypothetical protein